MNAEIDISNVELKTPRLLLRPWRESDLIDFSELLNRLKVRKLTDQVLFHTERALSILKYTGSEVVQCPRK